MAASTEPMTKVREITWSTLIPTSRAMVMSCWVARIALPMRVNLISTVSGDHGQGRRHQDHQVGGADDRRRSGSRNLNSGISAGKGRKSGVCESST